MERLGYFTPAVDCDGFAVPQKKYDIVLVDPPWPYYGSTTKDAAAGKHYSLMSMEDLKAMPVKDLLKKEAAVFMWATCPRLHYAVELINSWGLHYRGVAWVWVKTRKDGQLIHGQGVPPTFTKPTTEMLLAASTKPRGRPITIQTSAMRQVVTVPENGGVQLSPRGKHSQKPAVFVDLIDELFGAEPDRVELFCRGLPRQGWHGWGDECHR
jgi:N6-adenosine-specific RNA methylase IME4